MKTLAQALPAGLNPEPTPSPADPDAGPSRAPGAGPHPPAPGVCEGCRQGHPVMAGKHYRVALEGTWLFGTCTAPRKAAESVREPVRRHRSHPECQAELHRMASEGSASRVLAEARATFAAQSVPREPGEDDE